uniref:Uncharacterized protein n=1 Tax=Arundo donax TaxID=35708 RepID=A0A0A9E1E3_ARUDO
MFIHSKSAKPEDIEETLCHVYSLFTKLEMEEDEEGLVIVILPEDECSHVKVKDVRENHGVISKCCLPVHARRSSRQYLMKTACEINKAVQRDKVTEADGPEQSGDSDAETVYRHSHNKSGENDFVGSDEESEEVDSSDKESKEDEGPEQPEGSDEFTSEDDGSELPDGVETREHDGFEDEGPGQLKQMGKYVAESSNRKCVHHVDVQVEEVKGKVKNWACVSFSHSCRKETFRFLDKLKDTCVAIGMDFFSDANKVHPGKVS